MPTTWGPCFICTHLRTDHALGAGRCSKCVTCNHYTAEPAAPTVPHYGKQATSNAAADSMREHVSGIAARILGFIRDRHGATCDECEQGLHLSHQTASAAINTLMTRGVIYDSTARRNTRSGRKAIVWQAAS